VPVSLFYLAISVKMLPVAVRYISVFVCVCVYEMESFFHF